MSEHTHHHHAPAEGIDPVAHWEEHYGTGDRVWSGAANASLVAVLEELAPSSGPSRAPRALDIGCGEGADAIWLARAGWRTTGVDISPTAIGRAQEAAREAGLGPEQLRLIAADLSDPVVDAGLGGPFDLVTASFFHSTIALPRTGILRRAAALLAPGGRLLVISHAAPPPWARGDFARHREDLLDPDAEVAALDLPAADFAVERAELRRRAATAPDGTPAELEDGVVLIRRR
ncbi:methyltransferase [Brachybacterium phenoliresistens]|uniref:Methyltransferase n=1 Tax=Brachybacterium phenoliresistens TaxID=396014 RepID=Z9JRF8_9MICO|nr:class I SAM-dependent methyltransferase [Brachybacterium phenoliresistens]EWS80337.1 methyltransferase [Brachybacterium phenoliresistens]